MADRNGREAGKFRTVLFPGRPAGEATAEPDSFADLNLDQVLAGLTAGREEYELEPLFQAAATGRGDGPLPARGASATCSNDDGDGLRCAGSPIGCGRHGRTWRRQATCGTTSSRERWFLDAAGTYCASVRTLADELSSLDVTSRGLRSPRATISTSYVASDAFASLETEGRTVEEALGEVVYAVQINGPRVTVTGYAGEPDYSAEVEQTFARFKQGAAKSYLVELREWPRHEPRRRADPGPGRAG